MATKPRAKMVRRDATLDDILKSGARYQQFAEDHPAEAPPPAPSGAMRRVLGDGGIAAVQSAIGLTESAVGLADLATGGAAGKFLENEGGAFGYRPKMANQILNTYKSPEQQAADKAVQEAEGFLDTAIAALKNPSVPLLAVVQSSASIIGGGVIARSLLKGGTAIAGAAGPLRPGLIARMSGSNAAPVIAGAAGEGIITAGSQAEAIRQETTDGLLTGEQSGLAAASGLATGMLGYLGGKVAQRLGIADIDTMLAGKAGPEVTKGFTRRVLEGAVSEGLLEELPQSVQEQVAQNMALGKPLGEGVAQAAVLGALAGGLMGAGGNAISHGGQVRREKVDGTGAASRAINAGLEDTAQQADAIRAAAVPPEAPAASRASIIDPRTGYVVHPDEPEFEAAVAAAAAEDAAARAGIPPAAEPEQSIKFTEQPLDGPEPQVPIVDDEAGGMMQPDPRAQREADRPAPPTGEPEPTDGQKKATNYAMGHHKLAGLDLSIENPAGSVRSGTDRDGNAWSNTLQSHYGYIKGTTGNDKDHVDAFVKPGTPDEWNGTVFVVDQVHPDTGKFDEHKSLLGFDSMDEAKEAYRANYAKGWKGLKAISAMPAAEFKTWVKDGRKNKPLAPISPTAPAPETASTHAAAPVDEPIIAIPLADEGTDEAARPPPQAAGAEALAPAAAPAAAAPAVVPGAAGAGVEADGVTAKGKSLLSAAETKRPAKDLAAPERQVAVLDRIMGGVESQAAPAPAPTTRQLSDAWDGMSLDARSSSLQAVDINMNTPTGRASAEAKRLAGLSWEKLPPDLWKKAEKVVRLYLPKPPRHAPVEAPSTSGAGAPAAVAPTPAPATPETAIARRTRLIAEREAEAKVAPAPVTLATVETSTAPEPTSAAKAEPSSEGALVERPSELIELRKRESVLTRLLECLA